MMKKKVLIVEDEYVAANDLVLIVEKAGYNVLGIARSVPQALELAEQQRPDLALVDITLKGKQTGIDLARKLGPMNIPFIFLSANCSAATLEAAKRTQPYGYLLKPYRTHEVLIAMEIAEYRHENHVEGLIRQQGLIEEQLSSVMDNDTDLPGRLLSLGKILQSYLPFDYLGYEWYRDRSDTVERYSFHRVGFDEYQRIDEAPAPIGPDRTTKREPVFGDLTTGDSGRRFSKLQTDTVSRLKMESILMVPLDPGNDNHFQLYLASRQSGIYKNRHQELAGRLQGSLTDAIRNILGMRRRDHTAAADPGSTRRDEREDGAFRGIVGNSHLLLHVFDLIKQVAPMDSTVLILGESGTGKEKIAESIHRLSNRKEGPFIRINCAGFPPSLIESELFGHEKGSFTGATDRRIGKFEQADRGTIFLDEIGEMPLESQVKLLRVLQERQIERIGGRTITVDIRIIAATNRNLEQEVADGKFRLDLYYRLNVFPIELPALRDRSEDIGQLTRHFITLFRQRTGKEVRDVHSEALLQMAAYHWPGNIRELEHVIERSLVLCRGEILEQVMLPGRPAATIPAPVASETQVRMKSLKEFEKEYLMAVLKKCDGRLSGKNGAATILGIPTSTLHSKLIKLGIKSRGE